MNEFNIKVINNETGYLCNEFTITSEESIFDIAKRYVLDRRTALVQGKHWFCVCCNNEYYVGLSRTRNRYLEFFNDVIQGAYDNGRDAYHIRYGRVMEWLQLTDAVDTTELLNCIDNIWIMRYYAIPR